MEKKREHAALIVQRNWRRLKAQREYRRQRDGMRKELYDYERTDEDLKLIEKNRERLELLRG